MNRKSVHEWDVIERERLAKLEQQMSDARIDMADIKRDIQVIRQFFDRAQGGYRFLILTTTVSGALGALLAKFTEVVQWITR